MYRLYYIIVLFYKIFVEVLNLNIYFKSFRLFYFYGYKLKDKFIKLKFIVIWDSMGGLVFFVFFKFFCI